MVVESEHKERGKTVCSPLSNWKVPNQLVTPTSFTLVTLSPPDTDNPSSHLQTLDHRIPLRNVTLGVPVVDDVIQDLNLSDRWIQGRATSALHLPRYDVALGVISVVNDAIQQDERQMEGRDWFKCSTVREINCWAGCLPGETWCQHANTHTVIPVQTFWLASSRALSFEGIGRSRTRQS